MEKLDVNKLKEEFNHASESVRLVTLLSPTWPVCQYGQGVVRELFEQFNEENLKGFVVWLPMMRNDNDERARDEATTFEGLQVAHVWDPKHHLGDLYAETLSLHSTAWDVYFLYAPGVRWEGNEPPQPTFWMHQLPAASGADRTLVLYPTRLSHELLKFLRDWAEPSHVSADDLGLQLHEKGLANLVRERGQYTFEDIRQAVKDSTRKG